VYNEAYVKMKPHLRKGPAMAPRKWQLN
jgi:hypothetical protein